MDRQKAEEYKSELKDRLLNLERENSQADADAAHIAERFVEFIPEDPQKGMVILGQPAVFYNVGNVRFHLKDALLAGLQVISAASLEDIVHCIQLLIVSVLFIRNIARQELTRLETYAIYCLHQWDAYRNGMKEDLFVREMQEWYLQKIGERLEQDQIESTVSQLYEMKIADLEDGTIYLKEIVWGKLD